MLTMAAVAECTNGIDCSIQATSCHFNHLPDSQEKCSNCDDDYMVRVRAQVMTRDDSSGGWLPTHGGGMSVVGLRSKPSTASSQYLIYGQRVSDQAVVLDCAVNDDLHYVKATPTFHHWRTRGKRFGLTFHSSADANVFESCIHRATQHLLEGGDSNKDNISEVDDELAILKLKPPADANEVSSLPASRTRTPSPTATMRIHNGCSGSQRLSSSFAPSSAYHPFSCPHLDFAVERSFYWRYVSGNEKMDRATGQRISCQRDAENATEAVSKTTVPSAEDIFADPSLATRTDGYVRFSRTDVSGADSSASVSEKLPASSSLGTCATVDGQAKADNGTSYPVMYPHDYEYPAVIPGGSRPRQLSVTPTVDQVVLPKRCEKKRTRRNHNKTVASATRARCIYCQELFFVSENVRGVCPDAPDDCAACIERATCLCAARALLYHCATDEDGNYGVICGIEENITHGNTRPATAHSESRRRRKWVLLALLSIVLPCLWCYPAMAACHACAVRRGQCGARHRAA